MQIEQADKYRESIIALLETENLPVTDLPDTLETFAIIKQNDEVIGVVGLEIYEKYGLLRSLAVNKFFRGQGIAGDLLLWVEKYAASKSLKTIYLLTETAADYFQKKGYQKITREDVPAEVQASSEFSHVCPLSAIVMSKSVQKH